MESLQRSTTLATAQTGSLLLSHLLPYLPPSLPPFLYSLLLQPAKICRLCPLALSSPLAPTKALPIDEKTKMAPFPTLILKGRRGADTFHITVSLLRKRKRDALTTGKGK